MGLLPMTPDAIASICNVSGIYYSTWRDAFHTHYIIQLNIRAAYYAPKTFTLKMC